MDSSQVQKNEFTVEYWKNLWKEGITGWHRTGVNPALESYFDEVVGTKKKQRILFPFCGKSLDMKWVADKGHLVVGVDGCDQAVKEFFADNHLECKVDTVNIAAKNAALFSTLDDKIRIFVCDMFDFRSSVAGGPFDGIFDRGALVAVNPKDRPRYAEMMADLVLPGGKILAECFEYDPYVYGGTPNHVPEHHVREIYGKNFDVQQLEREIDDNPKYKNEYKLDEMIKCIYLMTRKQ